MNRFRIILAILILTIVSLLVCQGLREREPAYRGKPLSFWLHRYDTYEGGSWVIEAKLLRETDDSVRHIGTNAIPFLLQKIRANDSPLKLKLIELASRQRLLRINFVPAEILKHEAVSAFDALGGTASNAVPELIEIYSQNVLAESRNAAAQSLGLIGPPASKAVPLLLAHASSTNIDEGERINAIFALGRIHAESGTIVPALITLLHDRSPQIQAAAAYALGEVGLDARPAVTSLVEHFKDESGNGDDSNWLKNKFGEALKKINPEAAAKAGVK